MENHAYVRFEKEEAADQKRFLRAMNGVGIIAISEDEIAGQWQRMKDSPVVWENDIVLHNSEEEDLFRHVMDVFFPEKAYRIEKKEVTAG